MPFARGAFVLEAGPFTDKRVHFIDHGSRDGQVVLLVHGNPTWSFLWRKVIAALDPHEFRCVAPDLLGLGLSDLLPRIGDHSLAGHVEAIGELWRALDLEDAIIVGQDWGGPVAVGVGSLFPEQVKAVVLGNTSVLAPKRPRGTAFHRFARMPLVSDFVFRVLGFPQDKLARVQGDKASIQGDVARAYKWPLSSFGKRIAPLALARMVPDSPDHPTMAPLQRGEAWLRSFAGPMALVWGERDPILGRALKRHVEAFPQAAVTRTDAGHFLQEEVPDEIAAAIRSVAAP